MAGFFGTQPIRPTPNPEPPGFSDLRNWLMMRSGSLFGNPYGMNSGYQGGQNGMPMDPMFQNMFGYNRQPFNPRGGGGGYWGGGGSRMQGPQGPGHPSPPGGGMQADPMVQQYQGGSPLGMQPPMWQHPTSGFGGDPALGPGSQNPNPSNWGSPIGATPGQGSGQQMPPSPPPFDMNAYLRSFLPQGQQGMTATESPNQNGGPISLTPRESPNQFDPMQQAQPPPTSQPLGRMPMTPRGGPGAGGGGFNGEVVGYAGMPMGSPAPPNAMNPNAMRNAMIMRALMSRAGTQPRGSLHPSFQHGHIIPSQSHGGPSVPAGGGPFSGGS